MDKAVAINADLLRQVLVATGEQTEPQAVERVLRDYVDATRRHVDLLALIGKVRFRDDYDPRAIRFSRHDGG